MKSKLNLPLVYNDAGSEPQYVKLIVSGLLNERKTMPLLKKAGYFYLYTAFQTTGFKRVAYRTYFPSTGYEQFLSIMYGSYRHPGEREQGPKCPGRCKRKLFLNVLQHFQHFTACHFQQSRTSVFMKCHFKGAARGTARYMPWLKQLHKLISGMLFPQGYLKEILIIEKQFLLQTKIFLFFCSADPFSTVKSTQA